MNNEERWVDLIKLYLEDKQKFGPLAWSTTDRVRTALIKFMRWLGGRVLTRKEAVDYINYVRANSSTPAGAAKNIDYVKPFCTWLVTTERMKENPFNGLRRPRVRLAIGDHKVYTRHDYQRLRDSSNEVMRHFVILAWHTGMSMVDCCTLRWDEIDWKTLTIRHKRRKMRSTAGNEQVVPFLQGSDLHTELLRLWNERGGNVRPDDYVNPNMYALFHTKNNAYEGQLFRNWFQKACFNAGVEWKGTHAFRHAFCSAVANDPDINIVHAMQMTGHRNVAMLRRYVRVNPGAIRKSVERILRKHVGADEENEKPGETSIEIKEVGT